MSKKIMLNPDAEVVEMIKAGLKARGGHCPCLVEKSPDTLCPCKEFRDTKHCHCGLYATYEEEK